MPKLTKKFTLAKLRVQTNRCFCGILIGVFAVPALNFCMILTYYLRVIELAASRFFWFTTSA